MDRWTSPRGVLALVALVAALAVSACGDDGDDGGDAAKAPSADSARGANDGDAGGDGAGGDNANAADGGAGADGGASGGGNASAGDTEPINLKQAQLTPAERQRLQGQAPTPQPYDNVFDRGSKKDKATLLRIFRQMQRDFFGARFTDFCEHFGTSLYALPDLQSGDSKKRLKECAAIVSRIGKRLAQGKIDWIPYGIQWIRVYNDPGMDPYGGITMQTGRRKQFRAGFVKENGRWRPDFRIPKDIETMNAR